MKLSNDFSSSLERRLALLQFLVQNPLMKNFMQMNVLFLVFGHFSVSLQLCQSNFHWVLNASVYGMILPRAVFCFYGRRL
jgi:hypothetical protein